MLRDGRTFRTLGLLLPEVDRGLALAETHGMAVQVNNWLLGWAEPEAVAEQALSAWPAPDWTAHTCKQPVHSTAMPSARSDARSNRTAATLDPNRIERSRP
jgi:hypothetical protein